MRKELPQLISSMVFQPFYMLPSEFYSVSNTEQTHIFVLSAGIRVLCLHGHFVVKY